MKLQKDNERIKEKKENNTQGRTPCTSENIRKKHKTKCKRKK